MRTVTFSDPKVAELVNASFVCAWSNRGPGFHNEDYSREEWIHRAAGDAYATKNICTFFLTPDGRVFHYIAGYYSPPLFMAVVEAALKIHRAADPRAVHAELAIDLPKTFGRAVDVPSYRERKHEHGDDCKRLLAEARDYIGRLHRRWSEIRELPSLESVRFKYLAGNSFTEEPRRGANPIE